MEVLDEKDFEEIYERSPGTALGLMFKEMRYQRRICLGRPEECNRRFVKVRHVVMAAIGIMGILIGMGYIQIGVLMPGMIKAAVTAAMVP